MSKIIRYKGQNPIKERCKRTKELFLLQQEILKIIEQGENKCDKQLKKLKK